ncbi:MAG: AAA family ATPase [Dehalococcoidia bacterium]|nr:AAA family ATPase [Dehalococcoidia bacterium]
MSYGKLSKEKVRRAAAEDFFDELFFHLDDLELIELRYKPVDGKRFDQKWVRASKVVEIASKLQDKNDVYFGVVPRVGRFGDAEHTGQITTLWADVDAKCFRGGKAEALLSLNSMPVRPSIVVDSGNGYHAYWLLKFSETISREDAKASMDGIRGWLDGRATKPLDSVGDMARILRVPYTLNHKDVKNPQPVRTVLFKPSRRYTVEEFKSSGLYHTVGVRPTTRTNGTTPHTSGLADEKLIHKATDAANGEWFTGLYEGNWEAAYPSQSEADLALVGSLAFWTGGDAEQIDRLFRASGLFRDKWDERHNSAGMTYGEIQIDKVLSTATEFYRNGSGHSSEPSASSHRLEEVIAKARTAKELCEATPEKVDWLLPGYVAVGALTEIVGKAKFAGKSTFIGYMLDAVLGGKPFLGHDTQRTPVVYITEEYDSTFRQLLTRTNLTNREDLISIGRAAGLGMTWRDWVEVGRELCVRNSARLLVVDTVGGLAGLRGDDSNSAGEVTNACNLLRDVAAQGIAVVAVIHERKAGGNLVDAAVGSLAYAASADIIARIKRVPEKEADDSTRVRIIEAIGRYGEQTPEQLTIELTDGKYRVLGACPFSGTCRAGCEVVWLDARAA